MAGEDFLKFNNGQKISFSNFKEIKEDDLKGADPETMRLFNIFAGEDKILQENEAKSLWDKLKNAAKTNLSGDYQELDDSEIETAIQELGLNSEETAIDKIKNLFTTIFSKPETNTTSETADSDETDDSDSFHFTFKETDKDGNIIETTILYDDENISKQICKKNEETVAIISYDYSEDSENPTTSTLYKNENGVIEEIETPKMHTLTLYEGDDIEKFDKNAPQLFQSIARYDENGNTFVVIQYGENLSKIAKKFNVKLADLMKLNHLKADSIIQAGQELLIPGKFKASDKNIITRRSKQEVLTIANNDILGKAYDKVLTSSLKEETATPECAGKNVYEYAEKYLIKNGAVKTESGFKAKVNDLANELIVANGKNATYSAGSKVLHVDKTLNAQTVQKLKNAGFAPNQDNQRLYARFNYLTPQQQNNVISILNECKAQGIKDKNIINNRILNFYPDIQLFETDKNVLTKPTRAMARAFAAQYLLEQIDNIIALYNQVANSDKNLATLGTGLTVEAEDILSYTASFINKIFGTNIDEGDARRTLAPKLNDLRSKLVKLVGLAKLEEETKNQDYNEKKKYVPERDRFDEIFREISGGKEMDYDGVISYLEAVKDFQNAPEIQRINKNSAAHEKVEIGQKKLDELLPALTQLSKTVDTWANAHNAAGGLTNLALDIAFMYMSGGGSAIAKSTLSVGNAVRYSVGQATKKMALKEGTQFVVKESAAAISSIVTSSAETAAFFQARNALGAIQDGKVTREEVEMLEEGFTGLFEFGVVGSTLAGPLGQKSAELINKMFNSEKALASTIKLAVEGKGTTLDKVLSALSKNSEAISKFTEFGTSFSINAGYMAAADDMNYDEAMGSLAQMDAVSKLVAAMLGHKNTAFLTPQKVQQVKTSLAGYDVNLAVYKGKKIYEVTDKNGEKTRLANEKEVTMFILNKVLSTVTEKPVQKNTNQPSLEARIASANSREEFAALRDEIKAITDIKQKQELGAAHARAYMEWNKTQNKDIKMINTETEGVRENDLKVQDLCAYKIKATCTIDGVLNQELFNKALELETLGIENDNIAEIMEVLIVDGKLSEKHLNALPKLLENFEQNNIAIMLTYPDFVQDWMIELKKEYGVKESDLFNLLYTVTIRGASTNYCHPEMMAKVKELIQEHKANPSQIYEILDSSVSSTGEFSDMLYNQALKLHQEGFEHIERIMSAANSSSKMRGSNANTDNIDWIDKAIEWKREGMSDAAMSRLIKVLRNHDTDIASDDFILKLHKAGFENNEIYNIIRTLDSKELMQEISKMSIELKEMGFATIDISDLAKIIKSEEDPNIVSKNIETVRFGVKNGIKDLSTLIDDNGAINIETIKKRTEILQAGAPEQNVSIIDMLLTRSYMQNKDPEFLAKYRSDLCELANALGENSRNLFEEYGKIIGIERNRAFAKDIIDVIKKGAEHRQLMNIFSINIDNYIYDGNADYIANRFKQSLLDVIKETPEKSREIVFQFNSLLKTREIKSPELMELCLKNPENAADIIDVCRTKIGPHKQISNSAAELYYELSNAGADFTKCKAITEKIFEKKPNYYEMSQEIKTKLVELYKQNKLDEAAAGLISYFHLKGSQATEVIDKIAQYYAEGKLEAQEYLYIFEVHKKQWDNPVEILDFYVANKEFFNKSNSRYKLNDFIYDIANKRQWNDTTSLNISEFQFAVNAVKEDAVSVNTIRGLADLSNDALSRISVLFEKCDLTKNHEAWESICKYYAESRYLPTEFKDFSTEDINFLLECQQMICDSSLKTHSLIYRGFENLVMNSTPESKEMLKELINTSIKQERMVSFADFKPLIDLINTRPEVYGRIAKLIPELPNLTHYLQTTVKNFTKALENNCSDEVLAFLQNETKDGTNIVSDFNFITDAIVSKPEFMDAIIKGMELNGKLDYGNINVLLLANKDCSPEIKEANVDILIKLLCEKNEYGNVKYNLREKALERYLQDGKRIPIEDIEFLSGFKDVNGKELFDFEDMFRFFEKYQEQIDLLKENPVPTKQVNANTLYERTFTEMKDEVAKFGCSTFEEFEALIPTLSGKERGEAGKLLGKIKAQTISRFLENLPDEVITYLTGSAITTKNFCAADLENALQLINNNPVLRRHLTDIEKTGQLTNDSFSYVEEQFLAQDKTLIDMGSWHFSDFDENPVKAKKIYSELSQYYEIFKEKAVEFLKHQYSEEYEAVRGDVDLFLNNNGVAKEEITVMMAKAAKYIGMRNISGLVHNESAIKAYDYINKCKSWEELSDDIQTKIIKLLNRPEVKDQELKALISIIDGLKSSEETLNEFLDNISSGNKINFNTVYKDLLSFINEKCDINLPITEKMLEGWDKEYLPYVYSALNSLESENAELLKGILRVSAGEENYQSFLFEGDTPNAILNRESRQIFEENKLDFEQFMNFNGKVEFDFKPKAVDIQPIKISTIEDFIAMSNEPAIKQEFEAFKAKHGISYDVENKKLMINGQEASRPELVQLIGLVNKFISENKAIANTKIADVKDHFVQRKRALAKSISNDAIGGKVSISLWSRNPKHDLFQGHYCQCCVSLDGINKHSIVQTLSHTVDQIAELKDASGNTVGKVKMLFLKDTQTGEPILLANGFEIIAPYNFDNNIRDQFVNFMRQYGKAVTGKEIPIYTGVTYQKINFDDLPDVSGNYQLLGKTPNNTYHLDSFSHIGEGGSHPTNLDKPHDLKLKVMYDGKSE